MVKKLRDYPEVNQDEKGNFYLIDDEQNTLRSNVAQRVIDEYASYFFDKDNLTLHKLNYIQLTEFIDALNHKLKRKNMPLVHQCTNFSNFIKQSKYEIKEHAAVGLMIKNKNPKFKPEFEFFKIVVANEIDRLLYLQQEWAAFYLATMKRAANFSVPGAGKTTMLYATYAFLSSRQEQKVNKILVICPLNAFAAWQTEYEEVFGNKRNNYVLNLRDKKYKNNNLAISFGWGKANLILINYESLQNNLEILNQCIDNKTMLVFDEVHRIKGIGKTRAKAALNLSKKAKYRYVLTGTPIPNGYSDVYNFLHLMYPNEYRSYFGWSPSDLNNIGPKEVNNKLAPFFCRINKKDLKVPVADPDESLQVNPSNGQKALTNAIYQNENGALARFIRLLQASTNPQLLYKNIDYRELNLVDGSDNFTKSEILDEENEANATKVYSKFQLDKISSPKFDKGIELVEKLVHEGKKVLVWGMFVGTMEKIADILSDRGLYPILIYGKTPVEERNSMIDQFKHGHYQVLISNPNTLGESISLHKEVHDAIYFEYNFNLTFMLQSRDRIHRLGLKPNQHTHYYYLMTCGDVAHKGFIDQKVYDCLKEKEEIMKKAIDGQLLLPEYKDDYIQEVKNIVYRKY